MLAADQLHAAMGRVLTSADLMEPTLQYGPDPGHEPLREQLAAYLSRSFAAHGTPNDPERICVTGGASQSMANLMLSFSDPDYTLAVWIGAPCYHLACAIYDDAGFSGRLRAVPEDAEGIDLVRLEKGFVEAEAEAKAKAKTGPASLHKQHLQADRKAFRHIVYVVPASSNPTGRTMSVARRQALVRLARRYDALVIADDVYDFLQWPTAASSSSVSLPPPLPRLVDVDRLLPYDDGAPSAAALFGNAISNGSFSKLVGPGVRTGWVEGTPAFVYGLAQTGNSKSGGAPSQLCASAMADMMESGAFDRHLSQNVRPDLQRRHRALAAAIATHLRDLADVASAPDATYGAQTFGGYFIWLRLRRPDIRAADLAARAQAAENLVVSPGSMFEVHGDEASAHFDHHIRLCFAYEDEHRLAEGVERLARVLRDWDSYSPVNGTGETAVPGAKAFDKFN